MEHYYCCISVREGQIVHHPHKQVVNQETEDWVGEGIEDVKAPLEGHQLHIHYYDETSKRNYWKDPKVLIMALLIENAIRQSQIGNHKDE